MAYGHYFWPYPYAYGRTQKAQNCHTVRPYHTVRSYTSVQRKLLDAKFSGTEIFTHNQGPKYPIHAKFSGTEILTHDQGVKYLIHAGTEVPTYDQGVKYRIPQILLE